MYSFSDIAFMVFLLCIVAAVMVFEIHTFIVWAIPRGLFTSVLYLLGCLGVDSFMAGFLTMGM